MNKFIAICLGAISLSVSLCFIVFAIGLAIRISEGC